MHPWAAMRTKGIFAGLSTIDIIYTVSEPPAKNRKTAAQSQQILIGGPASNAAITFAFLGGSATLVAPVGRHPLSSMIKDECRQFEIDLIDLSPESQEAPPLSSVWVDAEGQRSVVSANTSGRIIPPARVDTEALAEVGMLMVDGHAMQACKAWADAAKAAGIPVVLDGGSWKNGTDLLLKSVDVAICSADFLPPCCSTHRDVIDFLQAAGVTKIAITHGADPIQFVSSSGSGAIEVPQIEAVDTTGAGDIFHGAFCFDYASGCEFEQALRKAASIASESCRYRGTRKWMQSNSERRSRFFSPQDSANP
jgi:sugar/nucleoside kinase (ribokinase family)